ncbi:MAG: hypothetical protein WD025_06665 [Bacteriovoracaceae bacterium]
MKSALIITDNPEAFTLKFLRETLERASYKVLLSELPGAADLVINRNFGMDYSDDDLDALEKSGLQTLNPVSAQRICRDKWKQFLWAREQGLKLLPTSQLKDWVPASGKCWVLKTVRGMQGRGVSFHNSSEDLQERAKLLKDARYIVQEKFLFKKEIRSYHIGEEVFWFEKSGGNLYQGGEAKALKKVDAPLEQTARHIQKELGLRLAASCCFSAFQTS